MPPPSALNRTGFGPPNHRRRARPHNFQDVHLTGEGFVLDQKWVVTPQGVEFTSTAGLTCHVNVETNGRFQQAGPGTPFPAGIEGIGPRNTSVLVKAFELVFPGDTFAVANGRSFTTPWEPDPRVEAIRELPTAKIMALFNGGDRAVSTRFSGSPWHQTKIPDLHILRHRRYIDATGIHRLRGPEDLARYAALVVSADSLDFGKYRFLTDQQRKIFYRYADEVLYAIGVYLMDLRPAKNPRPARAAQLAAGQKIFNREGCANCHVPPDYTSGKLTLATGYKPPGDHPDREQIAPMTVGTDPGLALKTRKGTGFWLLQDPQPARRLVPSPAAPRWFSGESGGDVPSGQAASQPCPRRLEKPGWGRPFGLRLTEKENAGLPAFLRSPQSRESGARKGPHHAVPGNRPASRKGRDKWMDQRMASRFRRERHPRAGCPKSPHPGCWYNMPWILHTLRMPRCQPRRFSRRCYPGNENVPVRRGRN